MGGFGAQPVPPALTGGVTRGRIAVCGAAVPVWAARRRAHEGRAENRDGREILSNPRQLNASLWLMQQEHIQLRNVIGHNESLTSPYHKELYAPWRCQTHADWNRADMDVYRAKLARLAKQYGAPLGPPAVRVTPTC